MIKKTGRKSKRTPKRRKKNKKTPQSRGSIAKLIILIGTIAFIVYYFIFRSSPEEEPIIVTTQEKKIDVSSLPKSEAIDHSLNEVFTKFDLLESWISKQKNVVKIRIPQEVPAIVLIHEVINKMEKLDCKILNSSEDLTANQSTIEIGYKDKLIRKIILTQEPDLKRIRGKIAIIVDDFGYSETEEITKLLQFPYQITISIIPGLSKSEKLYQQAHKNKKETMIHLPMEAIDEEVENTAYTLYTTNISDDEIRQRIRKAIKDFPDSKVINNHMGSQATTNKHIMELMMQELKKSNIYFIDSKTTKNSVAYQTAKELMVPSAERDMFLDQGREDKEDYLRKKLIALTKIVKKKGSAIAIAHPRKNTVKVLMEKVPELEKQGYVFVPVSELVK